MKYQKFNSNPKGLKTTDCVIKAISMALERSWYEVFDDLVEIARETASTPNAYEVYSKYLSTFTKITPLPEKGKRRLKVRQLNDGIYIVKIANHLTCVKEGVLLDTWDCREKCVYRYWIIKGGEKDGYEQQRYSI